MNTAMKLAWERRCAGAAINHLWNKHRIAYKPIVMIVYDMAVSPGKPYWEALADWAAYEDFGNALLQWPACRWHSEICYRLLKAGADVPEGVAAWFAERAREVRAIADGISA